jgi:hypothetical protein
MSGGGGGSYNTDVQEAEIVEPIKSAESEMAAAHDETSRAQKLRRGVASTFSRNEASGNSATAGVNKTLG